MDRDQRTANSEQGAPDILGPMFGRLALVAFLLGGCASSKGPDYLRVETGRYDEAFDAAMEAARHHDLAPTLRDRRGGVIETETSIAASVLDFWRGENASLDQAVENTVAFQRRRARFEFTPVEDRPSPATNPRPDLFSGRTVDVGEIDGPLELRVWVIIERAYQPGVQRDTWSRRLTTIARIERPATDPGAPTGPFWTPVARDPAFERRLLASVQTALGE